jgi:hypothetical protein
VLATLFAVGQASRISAILIPLVFIVAAHLGIWWVAVVLGRRFGARGRSAKSGGSFTR